MVLMLHTYPSFAGAGGAGVIFNKYLFIQLHEVLVAVHGISCLTACEVSAPQPEIEPMSPTLEGWVLNH